MRDSVVVIYLFLRVVLFNVYRNDGDSSVHIQFGSAVMKMVQVKNKKGMDSSLVLCSIETEPLIGG